MVTKQQQLEWLAKNCESWPVMSELIVMHSTNIGICGSCWEITLEEWQRERNKMQKKQEEKLMSENEFEDELEKMYWDFDAERAKKAKCERLNFKMFMRIASGLRVERKQENSWHERGQLPPVGVPVELWVGGSFACNCELISKRGNNYVLWNLDSDRADSVDYMHSQFRPLRPRRPLRTEREKAIDTLVDIICAGGYFTRRDGGARKIAERIYDAGLLK